MLKSDRLHYHIELEGRAGVYTRSTPGAARVLRHHYRDQGYVTHTYPCSTTEPTCPLRPENRSGPTPNEDEHDGRPVQDRIVAGDSQGTA